MSTHEDKITAVTAFLINRAQLRRVTNHEELQRVTGQLLFNGGRRETPMPLSREGIVNILKEVDEVSVKDKGVMLSALAVHFWDDGITPRFYEQAIQHGLLPLEADDVERRHFHANQLSKIFDAYPAPTTAPNDLSELFPQPEDSDDEADADAEF